MFFGLLGQGIRVFIGIYKIVFSENKGSLKDVFNWPKLILSFILGAVCGGLVWFILPDEPLTKVSTLLLLSAGYAGADFIEAFLKKKSDSMTK